MIRLAIILALAILSATAWSRSLFIHDVISRQSGPWKTVVLSFPGGVSLQRVAQPTLQERPWRRMSGWYGDRASGGGAPWRYLGFYCQLTGGEMRVNLPFWPVVAAGVAAVVLERRRWKESGERGFEVEPLRIEGLVPVEGRR